MSGLRRALPDDAPALAALTGQLGYPSSTADVLQRLEPILDSSDDAIIVADIDGEVVGWIHAGVERGLEVSGTATIRGLVVDGDHRSAGVGAELLEAAEAWARERGCATMQVRSRIARRRAHRFYEREGYGLLKTSHVFTKRLV